MRRWHRCVCLCVSAGRDGGVSRLGAPTILLPRIAPHLLAPPGACHELRTAPRAGPAECVPRSSHDGPTARADGGRGQARVCVCDLYVCTRVYCVRAGAQHCARRRCTRRCGDAVAGLHSFIAARALLMGGADWGASPRAASAATPPPLGSAAPVPSEAAAAPAAAVVEVAAAARGTAALRAPSPTRTRPMTLAPPRGAPGGGDWGMHNRIDGGDWGTHGRVGGGGGATVGGGGSSGGGGGRVPAFSIDDSGGGGGGAGPVSDDDVGSGGPDEWRAAPATGATPATPASSAVATPRFGGVVCRACHHAWPAGDTIFCGECGAPLLRSERDAAGGATAHSGAAAGARGGEPTSAPPPPPQQQQQQPAPVIVMARTPMRRTASVPGAPPPPAPWGARAHLARRARTLIWRAARARSCQLRCGARRATVAGSACTCSLEAGGSASGAARAS